MNNEQEIFEDWPCKMCIVRAACRSNCEEEIKWFHDLQPINKGKYLRSKLYNSLQGGNRIDI